MNMTNMKNVIKRLVFPLVVGGMVWFGGSATAQDIINITASHSGETIRGANTTIDINFTMQGRFALTNSDGGTFLQYPTLGVLLDSPDNNHTPNANADWSSFSTYSTSSGYKTVITFRYTVQAGDMAAPLRLVGYSAYDSNQAYYLTWNGWQVRNLDTGSNAVWQVNYLFAESGFGLSSSQLNLAAQKVTIETLDFDDNSSPATVAATDSTLWHVTASAATPAAVSLVAFAVDTNIVQIGNVPGQQKYDFNLPQGSTSTAFLVKGLIAGSTDIYVMRSTTYNSITNFSLPSSFTNFIKRTITVSAPPAPRVSVIMSTSGTESISLNEGTYQTFIVQLSEARTNDVMVDVASSSSCVMFGITNYTSTVSVRVPANSTSSSPVRFNALDGSASVELTPTVTSSAADVTYFADRRSGYVTVENVTPSVTARLASSTYATRGKSCPFSWTATDVAADTNSGMTVSWDFGDGTITNVTGAAGVISHVFTTTSSGRTVVVQATDKDGGSSSLYSFTVEVRDPEPQPTVRVVSSPTLCSETNGTGQLVVTLSQSYPGDVYVRLTSSIEGQPQNCLLFGTNTTKVVRIIQGDTNSAAVVYTVVDGTDLTYDPGVDITPAVTNAGPDVYYTSLYPLTLRIKNEAPIVTTPTSRDDSLGPAPAYTNVYLGRSFSFPYAVSDVAADQSSLLLTWDFGDASGNVVVTGYQGFVSHTYTSLGIKYVQMQAVDKDGAKSTLIRFPISVVLPPPAPTVRVLSPSAIVPESISYNNDYSIIVQLSESFTNDVAVGLTVTPPNSLANGTLLLSTNRVVFKTSDSLEKTIYIHALDGTDISMQTGFTITPSVLSETPAAQAYFTILDPGLVTVMNIKPTILMPASTSGTTNILYTIAQGIPWAFSWTVSDAGQDLTAMEIKWDFGDGGSLTTYGGSGTNAVHTYTSSGEMTVTMSAKDKDGDSSYIQFKVLVQASKEVLVTPIGPNTTSYNGASGTGYGTIASPEARSVSFIGSIYDFFYNPSVTSIKIIASPYTYAGYDSFFFTWVGGESLGMAAAQLSPYTVATLWSTNGSGGPVVAKLTLPDSTTSSSSSSSSSTANSGQISAIFSREYLPSDNMGDINQDGIPDKIAFLMEQTVNSGIDMGSLPPGMTDLSTFNGDLDKVGGTAVGDYLPINPTGSGGTYDFRPVSDGTGNNDFTAFLEVRGEQYDLHMRIGGVQISDDGDKLDENNKIIPTDRDEPHTDPMLADTDGDGLPDGWEYYFWYAAFKGMTGSAYNPANISQGTPIYPKDVQKYFEPSQERATLDDPTWTAKADNARDVDGDGLLDREELVLGTNPVNWDTDGDGICDAWEIMRGTDPCTPEGVGSMTTNPDGDYMAYAVVKRQFVDVVEGGVRTNQFLAPKGTPIGNFSGTLTTWYHYGSDTDPIAAGYPTNLSGVVITSSIETDVVLLHYQVLKEFGFDPRTAWTDALNNKEHPSRWPTWLADVAHTKPYTTRDEYLLLKFMSENRINGATDTMPATYSAWKAFSTDPLTPDSDVTKTDQDGMPDGWELYVSVNPSADLTIASNRVMRISPWNPLDGDYDHPQTDKPPRDGLINRREFAGTDSSAAYTNSALYASSNFVGYVSITRPASDALWINKFWPTNPWSPDTDGDGVNDLDEMAFIYGAPVDNGTACVQGGGLNPNSVDTDNDALPDAWEVDFKGTAPTDTTTTYAGLVITNGMDGTFSDYDQDWDHDGLKNYQEYWVQAVRGFRYDIPDVGVTSGPKTKNAGLPMDYSFASGGYVSNLFVLVTNAWDQARFPWGADKPNLSVMLRVNATQYVSTDPRDPDTDQDGMDDYYELFHGLNPILGEGFRTDGLDDRVARAYIKDGVFTIDWGVNDWGTNLPFDFTRYPWLAGMPEADPDVDGLLNLEEMILPNAASPSCSHTDPTPLWMTDESNADSLTARFYLCNSMYFWPGTRSAALAAKQFKMFSFEMNEGFDTDNDGLSDKAELAGSTDPLNQDDPLRRQALWFSGDQSAAQTLSERGTTYDAWTFRSFTVELWARPESVTNDQVLIERAVVYRPSDLSVTTEMVRVNFRLGIKANGSTGNVYAEFQNAGVHDDYTGRAMLLGPEISTNAWIHIAACMDGNNSLFRLFVNGKLESSLATSLIPANGVDIVKTDPDSDYYPVSPISIVYTPGVLLLGARNDNAARLYLSNASSWSDYSEFFKGYMDEVRVWDGARTEAEIKADYRKRYTKSDLVSNRDNVAAKRFIGGSRSSDATVQLPPELVCHYTFDNLFGADTTNWVAKVPRGFNSADVVTNRPAGTVAVFWDTISLKSTVYDDYGYVPWLENGVEHLPIFGRVVSATATNSVIYETDSVRDSFYWSTYLAGMVPTPSSAHSTNGVDTYSFPNTGNPYGYWYETSLGGTADVPDHVVSDLLPLGDAFAKSVNQMWDTDASSGVWSDMGGDDDFDGLADWWEDYIIALLAEKGITVTRADVSWYTACPDGSGLTYGQRYQYDLALGLRADGWTGPVQTADSDGDGLPDWWELIYGLDPNDATLDNGADGDPDGDGLPNFYEYLSGTDPFSVDSNSNGVSDYDEDFDQDGLSNGEEALYGTNPASADTDDDGLSDLYEVVNAFDPNDPLMPFIQRSLVNDGTGYLSIPKSPNVWGSEVDPDGQRFNLSDWTLSALVKLTSKPANDVIVVQRLIQTGTNVLINYELGISKDTLVPYVRFQTALGTIYSVKGYKPVETNVWTQIGGRFGSFARDNTRQLALIQDYTPNVIDVTGIYCATNNQYGDLTIAKNLIGSIDEVSIWKEARDDDQVEALRSHTLLFGTQAARAKSLTGGMKVTDPEEHTSIALDDDDSNTTTNEQGGSVELWFKTSQQARQTLIRKKTDLGATDGTTVLNYEIYIDAAGLPKARYFARYDYQWTVWQNNSQVIQYVRGWAEVELTGLSSVNDGNWHHVAYVLAKDKTILYIDGQVVDSKPFRPTSQSQVTQFHDDTGSVGDWWPIFNNSASYMLQTGLGDLEVGQAGFSGCIDEVRIFSTILDSSAIKQYRAKKMLPSDPSLKAYFDFDDVTFTADRPGVPDLVNEDLTGTLLNSASGLVYPNAPLSDNALDMMLSKIALYLPFDDGRSTNKVHSVDDMRWKSEGWKGGRAYAGTLNGNIDFSPLTTHDAVSLKFPSVWDPNAPIDTDSDGDGMPDSFEVYYGLDPNRSEVPDNADLQPDGDPDGDGLSNLYEYYAGTNPWLSDTDGDGVLDSEEDPDGDGLSNIEESRLGTHPMRPDSDDDGFADGYEVHQKADNIADYLQMSNPAFSDSPRDMFNLQNSDVRYRFKSMKLDGKAYQIPAPIADRKRFNLAAWTIEAWVNPSSVGQSGSLVRYVGSYYTNLMAKAFTCYDLGLNAGVPYIKMDTVAKKTYVATVSTGNMSLPTNQWTHLAGVFNPNNNALTLYCNGVAMSSVQILEAGLASSETVNTFPGKAYIGDAGLSGNVDEVRIWNLARTADDVAYDISHQIQAGDNRLVCDFRFDDGRTTGLTGSDGCGLTDGQGAEDYAHPMRPLVSFDSPTVTWLNSLDKPWMYSLRGITFDADVAYTGTKTDQDDYDGDKLPDWWEDLYFSKEIKYPVGYYDVKEAVTVISGHSDRSFSVSDLGWNVAFTPVLTVPPYVRSSDGKTAGRWYNTPDAAWLFKDVYMTAAQVSSAEMRFAFHTVDTNSLLVINGQRLGLTSSGVQTVSAGTTLFASNSCASFVTYYVPATVLVGYFHVGWNRIAAQQFNTDGSSTTAFEYEYFNLTLTADAGQTTLIDQGARWWIYGNLGSTVEPPLDKQGLAWDNPDYGLDTYADPDGDGLSNYYEMLIGTNPNSADTDGNGVTDAYEDADHDGVQNLQELRLGTDPLLPDTDDDGVPDLTDGYVGSIGSWATNALLPKVDRCLNLDGTGYLEAPLLSRWSSGTNSFTLLMSVKPLVMPVATTNVLAAREVYSGVFNYALTLLPSGQVRALVTVDTGNGSPAEVAVVSAAALTLSAWNDLSLVVNLDTQVLTLRVNGTLSGSVASSSLVQLPTTTGSGLVHTRFGVGFKGQIDNVAFYNAALTEATLAFIRANGILDYPTANLQACYLFDDGTGTNGVSGLSTWTTGQVQDFGCAFWSSTSQDAADFTLLDWKTGWRNAGTLVGSGASLTTVKTSSELAAQDQDGDGIPDWWEIKYGLNPYSDEGENGASGDPDGDGLSNYAEYLISEVYQFYPGLNPRLFSTSGTVSDYFLKQGSLYFGEMFTDHDFMEDSLESETARYIYDANADDDEDGWSNWAETRYSVAAALATGTNAVPAMMALDNTQYPIPTIEATFHYNGNQQGGAIVVQAYSAPDMNGQPDAVFSVTNASAWPLVATLKEANSGYVLEGTNYVFAFLDLDNSGTWNAGEPCGVATPFATRIGWDYNRLSVQLTDYTPGYLRLSLTTGQRSEDVVAGSAAASGSSSSSSASALEARVRVLRSSVDGSSSYQRVVLDKVMESSRAELHEGDLLGQGDLGLDWGLIDVPTTMNRERIVYDVFVGDATLLTNNVLVTTFTNWFDVGSDRVQAQASSPINGKYVYSARPTFKWTMPDRYTAFAIEIRKGSSSGTLIYQSGALQDPARDQITGEYVWDAPIYAGDRLPNGQIFASDTLYAWRVIALNSKFTLTTAPITWSSWNYFRLDVDAPPSSSGYGDLRASVKYFGPATHYLSGRVRVQAYRTASFSGVPDAEYTLSDAELGLLTNAVDSGTNAVVRGLLPSSMVSNYYVMAFIDLNTNGVRDAWESWGYANEYGEDSSTPYSPKPFDVKVSTLPNVANIVIEDADTDQDWFPDAWEYEQHLGDPNFLALTGPASTWTAGDTEVNPYLVTNGTQTVTSTLGVLSMLTGTTDADGDGVGDMVELLLGSNPNSASSVADGYTDLQKIELGVNPLDSLTFKVSAFALEGSTLSLTWNVELSKASTTSSTSLLSTSSAVNYVIEYTPSLINANWQEVGRGSLPFVLTDATEPQTVNSQISLQSLSVSSLGFFRVSLTK